MPVTEPAAVAAEKSPCAVASAPDGARSRTYASDATHQRPNETA